MLRYLKGLNIKVSSYFDLEYFVKFILLLLGLFYFNLFFIAVTDSHGRIYSPFLHDHFNYITALRNSLLYTSNAITHIFEINSYVNLPYRLSVINGAYVEAVYACLGIGLMIFWSAYVIAHETSLKSKIIWCFAGILSLWLLNALRISVLLIALQNRWKVIGFIDHHTLFNTCVYLLLFVLVILYSRENKKQIGSIVKDI